MPTKRTTLPALAGLTELDPSSMGEAMRGLSTQLQRNFVIAKTYYGLTDAEACRAAGYSESMAVHHSHEVSRHPGVQAALEEECRKLMKSEGPRSILALVEIRDGKANKPADRIKASTELLNRAGLHAVSETHTHLHEHVTNEEADRRIAAFFAERGVPADVIQKMLVQPEDMRLNAAGVFEIAEPAPLSDDPRAVYQRETRARRKGMTPEEIAADKARIRDEQNARLSRERAEHEARRAAEVEPEDEWADVEY